MSERTIDFIDKSHELEEIKEQLRYFIQDAMIKDNETGEMNDFESMSELGEFLTGTFLDHPSVQKYKGDKNSPFFEQNVVHLDAKVQGLPKKFKFTYRLDLNPNGINEEDHETYFENIEEVAGGKEQKTKIKM